MLLVSPPSIACIVYMKNTATRQIRQIHYKWKQKPRFSCDSIWSAAYHQIACGATQRFHTNHICWAHNPAAMQQPGQARDSRARQSALLKKISHGAGETKDREDEIDAMLCIQRVEEGWETRALRPLSPFDLGWLCLACALLQHECVQSWSLPDDGLHDDILLPAITWLAGRTVLF